MAFVSMISKFFRKSSEPQYLEFCRTSFLRTSISVIFLNFLSSNFGSFSFHNLLGEVMYSPFFSVHLFQRAHHCLALKAFYFYLTLNVPCHDVTLDMAIDVQLSPLDTVLVTMVTFGPSTDFDQSWYMTLSMVTNLFGDIDDIIITLGHCPGDHGHFWDIDGI